MQPAWKETVDYYVNSPKDKDPVMTYTYKTLLLTIFQLKTITARVYVLNINIFA